jgi:hypothetical protein
MARYLLIASCALLLAGCAGHTVYLTGRSTGVSGQSTFRLAHSDTASFTLGNRTFTGRWIYMEQGGAVGMSTATAYSGGQSATATGTAIGLPTGAGGTFIGAAADGTTLRCNYSFSEWNMQGLGMCKDSRGETYDMQIK